MKKKRQLAAYIARRIFEIGEQDGLDVHRIQFLGGSYPDKEVGRGGLNEAALIGHLYGILSDAEEAPELQ